MSFSTPSTPVVTQPGNIDARKLDSNQQTRALEIFCGRRWFPITWCVSHVYNYTAYKKSSGGGKGGKGGGSTTVARCDVAGLVCASLIDYIEMIEVNGEIVWAGWIERGDTHPEHTGDIVVPNVGTFRLHWGTSTASGDWLVLNSGGEDHPHYRDQPVLEMKGLECGSSGTLPNVRILVERAARFGDLDSGRSREGANPVTWLAEVVGNDFFGTGMADVIDTATADPLADALAARTRTVAVPGDPSHTAFMSYQSAFADSRQTLDSLFSAVMESFDGWVRRTGEKIEFGRFEHGAIDIDTLPELTLHDMIDEPERDNKGPDDEECISDAVVNGPDRDWRMEASPEIHGDDSARKRIGQMRTRTFTRDFLCTSYQRKEQAQQLVAFYSRPGGTMTQSFRRDRVRGLKPGERVVINYSPTTSRRVYRITQRRDRATGNTVDLTLDLERGLSPLAYVPPSSPVPDLPEPLEPDAVVNARIFQVPASWAGTPAPHVIPLAARPSAHTQRFSLHFSVADSTYDRIADDLDFAMTGTTVGSTASGASSVTIAFASLDRDQLIEQSTAAQADDTLLLFVGSEVMSVGSVTALGGGQYSLGVLRARRGTTAATHSDGARAFVIRRDDCVILPNANFPRTAATRYFKLPTAIRFSEQELADALKITFSFADTSVPDLTYFVATAKTEGIGLDIGIPWWPRLSYAQIYMRLTATTPGPTDEPDYIEAIPTADLGGRIYRLIGLPAGATRFFWARLVDEAGYMGALTTYVSATAAAAPAGAEGPAGPAGPQGPTGAPGANGVDGVDGEDGIFREFVWRRATTQPATPTGNGIPSGWYDDPPAGSDPLWMSVAKQELDGTLLSGESWSIPVRHDGPPGATGATGATGAPGANAKLVVLTSDAQTFQIAKSGTVTPSTVTLTATGQNLSGSPSFTVTAGSATLTGSGNTRSLASGSMSTDAITVRVQWDGQEDYLSVVKVREGSDNVVPILTNEAHTVPANTAGAVQSFAGAATTMRVYLGTVDDSANWSFTRTDTNVTSTLSGATATVTAMSADTGHVDITATRSGYPSQTKRFTVTKSRFFPVTPSAPTAATKSEQGTRTASDGTALAYFEMSLPALPANAIRQRLVYRAAYASEPITAGTYTNTSTATTRIEGLIPGVSYVVGTVAESETSASAFVAATGSPFTAPADTTIPAAPTGITYIAGNAATYNEPPIFRNGRVALSMKVAWNTAEADIKCWEWVLTTTDSTAAADAAASPPGPYLHPNRVSRNSAIVALDLLPGASYFRVRAIDHSENVGPWSGGGVNVNSYLTRPAGDMAEQPKNAVDITGGSVKVTTLQVGGQDAVPANRTVAGKPLSGDVTLVASDVGAVPTSRTINGLDLSANRTFKHSDVYVRGFSTTTTVTGSPMEWTFSVDITTLGFSSKPNNIPVQVQSDGAVHARHNWDDVSNSATTLRVTLSRFDGAALVNGTYRVGVGFGV